jgi:acetate kinase
VRDRVLVLNAGSSTLKASVLAVGSDDARASATVPMRGVDDANDALRRALQAVASAGVDPSAIGAVGHRVVHGGSLFTRTTLVDDAVVQRIRELAWLAPLHNPVAAEVIAAARAALPGMPHAAAFDSAFHATLPAEAYVYAVPYEWHTDWGYRRYGFHGLSVAWSVERASALLGRDEIGVVVAHLGAGCSVTAVWHGRSVSTSMGMTPLEGLVMGTRAGSVDPGVLLAAQRDHGLDPRALEDALEHHSGLLALSGRTAEMRELLTLAPTDERAALAISVFERSAAGAIAAAATALPRLDAVVFTGGIGENAATVRAGIVRRLAAIGVPPVHEEPGQGDRALVVRPVAVLVVLAREDAVIARELRALTRGPRVS